ncbi:MAG: hypothetical protein DRO11_08195 [Methanobacteriota archaeon]|nr:MAG: hypothetical protein DRO11_08195 [Euryarchaeota archaeon]
MGSLPSTAFFSPSFLWFFSRLKEATLGLIHDNDDGGIPGLEYADEKKAWQVEKIPCNGDDELQERWQHREGMVRPTHRSSL